MQQWVQGVATHVTQLSASMEQLTIQSTAPVVLRTEAAIPLAKP